MEGYQIADEPRAGGLAHLVVNPIWPLFAIMFGGAWLSWPWYVFNGVAVGSPTIRQEIALAVGGFLGSALLVLLIFVLRSENILTTGMNPYAFLVLLVWKLAVTYALFSVQGRTFGIYEYYGGTVKNGFIVLLLGLFVGRRALGVLFESHVYLRLVLS